MDYENLVARMRSRAAGWRVNGSFTTADLLEEGADALELQAGQIRTLQRATAKS